MVANRHRRGYDRAVLKLGEFLLVVAVAACLAGCGGGELDGDEKLAVAEANVALARAGLGNAEGSLSAGLHRKAQDAVDTLIRVYRDNRDAGYEGVPLRDLLQDQASEIDDFDADLAASLDRALE